MGNLKGKKAIITGGSRGLGKATAMAFAKEGIDVAITGRSKDDLEKTVSELKAFGVKATYEIFDVGNDELDTEILMSLVYIFLILVIISIRIITDIRIIS